MSKRSKDTDDDCPGSTTLEEIMEPGVSARDLSRLSISERQKDIVELMELVDVAAKLSGCSRPFVERLALLLGKSISMSRLEKRRALLCPELLNSGDRLQLLIDLLEREQRKLDELHKRFRVASTIA
jgi:hypothetical protein